MSDAIPSNPVWIWLNGAFLPAQDAAVSPFDRGFLYGDGLFETLRAENGCTLYLREHLERLYRSLAALKIPLETAIDWKELLQELLNRNGLSGSVAAVKLIVTRGVCPDPGLPPPVGPTVCLTAQRYRPPDPEVYRNGWRLYSYREGFSSPLAAHKSLNYLYALVARQAAFDAGDDEAILFDPQGRVAETSAGSLLARTDGIWWTPKTARQLPGTTLSAVSHLLRKTGVTIERRPATLDDLRSAKTLWVLNSLMGIMPVCRVDGRKVAELAAREASSLRTALFEQGKGSGD